MKKMMYLAVGYNCNHNCLFCPCGDKSKRAGRAPIDELIQTIDCAIENQRIDGVTISGGEPTLNPDFNRIIKYCISNGLDVGILSNGENFADIKNIKRLFEGIQSTSVSICVSLHSCIPSIHEELNRTPGSFNKTVNGLKNLIQEGFAVTVKQIICAQNYKSLPEFVEYVYEQFDGKASLELCGMDYCGMSEEEIEKVAVSFDKMGVMIEKAIDRVEKYRYSSKSFPRVAIADIPLCSTDPYYWRYFLASSRMGVTNYAAPEQDGKSMMQAFDLLGDCGTFYKECKNCVMENMCPGVWKYTTIYFPDGHAFGIKTLGEKCK